MMMLPFDAFCQRGKTEGVAHPLQVAGLQVLVTIREGLNKCIRALIQYAKAKARFCLGSQNQAFTRMILAARPWAARIL